MSKYFAMSQKSDPESCLILALTTSSFILFDTLNEAIERVCLANHVDITDVTTLKTGPMMDVLYPFQCKYVVCNDESILDFIIEFEPF